MRYNLRIDILFVGTCMGLNTLISYPPFLLFSIPNPDPSSLTFLYSTGSHFSPSHSWSAFGVIVPIFVEGADLQRCTYPMFREVRNLNLNQVEQLIHKLLLSILCGLLFCCISWQPFRTIPFPQAVIANFDKVGCFSTIPTQWVANGLNLYRPELPLDLT